MPNCKRFYAIFIYFFIFISGQSLIFTDFILPKKISKLRNTIEVLYAFKYLYVRIALLI